MTKDVYDLENVALLIKTGVNAIDAIHVAMTESGSTPECFLDGLYFVKTILTEQAKILHNGIGELIKEAKK